jgi:hypothetical protein
MLPDIEGKVEKIVDADYLTTISIWSKSTKVLLDAEKKIEAESYDSVINRLLADKRRLIAQRKRQRPYQDKA